MQQVSDLLGGQAYCSHQANLLTGLLSWQMDRGPGVGEGVRVLVHGGQYSTGDGPLSRCSSWRQGGSLGAGSIRLQTCSTSPRTGNMRLGAGDTGPRTCAHGSRTTGTGLERSLGLIWQHHSRREGPMPGSGDSHVWGLIRSPFEVQNMAAPSPQGVISGTSFLLQCTSSASFFVFVMAYIVSPYVRGPPISNLSSLSSPHHAAPHQSCVIIPRIVIPVSPYVTHSSSDSSRQRRRPIVARGPLCSNPPPTS